MGAMHKMKLGNRRKQVTQLGRERASNVMRGRIWKVMGRDEG